MPFRDFIVTTSNQFRRLLVIAAVLLPVVASHLAVAEERSPATNNPAKTSQTVEPASLDSVAPQQPAKPQSVPGPPPVYPQDPRVLFITAPDCEQCFRDLIKLRRPGGDFDAMRSRGWRIGVGYHNHVQIVERDEVAELVKEANLREFPAVVCISEGKVVRGFKSGCTTPLDAWTLGWLLNGKNERPAGFVAEPARVASTGSYRLRGNHWSVDGDWNPTRAIVLTHLRSPSHGYQVAASYKLETWSYEELRSLHDDLHEQEMALYPATRTYGGSNNAADDFSAGRKIMGR